MLVSLIRHIRRWLAGLSTVTIEGAPGHKTTAVGGVDTDTGTYTISFAGETVSVHAGAWQPPWLIAWRLRRKMRKVGL